MLKGAAAPFGKPAVYSGSDLLIFTKYVTLPLAMAQSSHENSISMLLYSPLDVRSVSAPVWRKKHSNFYTQTR